VISKGGRHRGPNRENHERGRRIGVMSDRTHYTNMDKGLSTQQAKDNLLKYGKNAIETNATSSALSIFLAQFPTLINAILGIATIVSFALGHTIDGSFLLAVILVNACFGFVQEFKAERALEKLKNYAAPIARVIRDGKEAQIAAAELVPDDLVVLSEGARIPADGKITHLSNLEIDEAILTGESLAVAKNVGDEVFSGTLVTKGKAHFVVTSTGLKTRFGQIANTMNDIKEERTPLQNDFDHLGRVLAFVAIIIGALVIPVGMYHDQSFIPLVLVAASIGIAAIPEGLPAVITIAFAVGTHRMAKRNAIVRKMAAIETLGAIQIVLVDKTGTITQNAMKVKSDWLQKKEALPLLLRSCVLGNTASLVEKANKTFDIIGDQTDGAMLLWANQHEHFPKLPQGKVLDEYVFDANSKTITTLWEQDGREYVFVRGAPESILDKSKLTDAERKAAENHFAQAAEQGLRVIGFAMKEAKQNEKKSRELLEQNLTFLGFLSLYDPPRPEIKDAVAKAHTAGIQVTMVTGDNERTALAIAKEVGLIEKDEDVITGDELEKLSDEELSSIIFQTRVFARTKPEQKLRLATLLQKKGYVVGVTGDGVNDALALKKANVGISMGKTGTDVAKEASDIILADDNFATLVKAIEEGRGIYKNIVNAIIYLLSGNLAEISLVFFAVLFNLPFPLLPTQILWINLVTDSLPALALATGSKDANVLSKKPRDPKTRLLSFNRILVIFIIGLSLAEFLIMMFSYLLQTHPEAQARTAVFNGLIYLHLLMVIALGWHSIRRGNVFLILTIIIIAALQLIITYTPFFQGIFQLAV
jgi:P-type Ca2+ transporter type 2C